MEGSYRIGELAKAADVPVSTVRYYENRGLLEAQSRTEGNYRIYGAESLKRLRFIRASQQSGFTLEDIRLLLGLQEGSVDVCGNVRSVIEKRLDSIRHQLKHLQQAEDVLEAALKWCRKPRAVGRCQVLDDLDAKATHPTTDARSKRNHAERR